MVIIEKIDLIFFRCSIFATKLSINTAVEFLAFVLSWIITANKMNKMKAIQFEHYGEPSVLKINEIERPALKSGEVLVQVKAFGINPIDWKLRSGVMQKFIPLDFPVTLGAEFAGIVSEVKGANSEFKVGDQVYGRAQHSYAEYVAVDPSVISIIPKFLSFAQAASLASGSQIAYSALVTLGNLQANQRVLIHAGAGGVGTAAIQIAKSIGAHVTTTASSHNFDLLQTLGADDLIDYHHQVLSKNSENYDLILDSVGGKTQIDSWALLGPNGTLISLVSDEQQHRVTYEHTPDQRKFFFMRGVQGNPAPAVHQLIQAQKLKPVIDQVFDFDDVAAAHLKSQSGHVSGKIVIVLT